MMNRVSQWLGRGSRGRRCQLGETIEQAIREQEACYGQLRQHTLALLYLQAKLESETVALRADLAGRHSATDPLDQGEATREIAQRAAVVRSERLLRQVRSRAAELASDMARCHSNVAALRSERLQAHVLPSTDTAPLHSAREQLRLAQHAADERALLAEAHAEVDKLLGANS